MGCLYISLGELFKRQATLQVSTFGYKAASVVPQGFGELILLYMPPHDKNSNCMLDLKTYSYTAPNPETDLDPGSKSPKPDTNSDSNSTEYKERCRLHSLLRDIRANFQIIRKSFTELITLNSDSKKNAYNAETPEIHKKIIEDCSTTINTNLEKIRGIFDNYPCISSHDSDTVEIIRNKWKLIEVLFEEYKKDESNKGENLKKSKQYIEENIYLCSFLTVPPRVAANLQTLKSGYTLDFHEEFKDEFCSKSQSNEMLKYLARHRAFIDDIIDESQGLIFKVDPRNKRWKSYASVLGAFILGVGAIVGFFWVLKGTISIIPLLKIYLVFLGGALFHIFIDAMKATKASTGLKFKSVEDWLLWVNIKELSIITGILLIDFTFIGLVTTFNTDPTDVLTLAAAGYSFDSIGDVVFGRFETIFSKKGEALKDTISNMK